MTACIKCLEEYTIVSEFWEIPLLLWAVMLVAVSILQKAEKPNLDQPSIMYFDLQWLLSC